MRLRPKVPRQHLLALRFHDARIRGRFASCRQEGASVQPQALGERNSFSQCSPVVLKNQVDREFGAAGIADRSDPHTAWTEYIEENADRLDGAGFAGYQRGGCAVAHIGAGAGYGCLYERNAGARCAPSKPGNFVRSAGRCADHDWPRRACGVLKLAEQRFNLFSTIECNNNRSGSAASSRPEAATMPPDA